MTSLAEFGWLSLFAEYLIKSTLVLVLALVLAALFRRRSASLRHFVLWLSLAGLLLLPIASSLGIGWKTVLLPARAARTLPIQTLPAPKIPDEEIRGRMIQRDALLLEAGPATVLERPGYAGMGAGDSGDTPWRDAPAAGQRLKSALPLLWATGLFVLLFRLAAGLFGAFRLTREGRPVTDPIWRALLERLLAAIRLQRKVRLKSHPEVLTPLTCGLFKPVVLVPAGHDGWTEEQRSSALIHELSHIKRADFLVMVLVRLSQAAFWFNPLTWVVLRRLKKEQEQACDELVLRAGVRPSTYAANLLFFKSSANSRLGHFAALLGLFGAGKCAFNERLAAILKQKLTLKEVKMKTKILLSGAVILMLAIVGMARPAGPGAAIPAPVVAFSAAGSSVTEPATIIRETFASSSSSSALAENTAAEPSQPEEGKIKEPAQEKKAEPQAEPKNKEEKRSIVITTKKGHERQLEITITSGDKVKTITTDKPVIIKRGAGGEVHIVTPEGKDLEVIAGEPLRLEITGDNLKLVKEGKMVKEGKEAEDVFVVVEPHIKLGKMEKVGGKTVHVVVEPRIKVRPHVAFVTEDKDNEILEKVRDIREKLKEVKEAKLDIQEVEKALDELQAELEESKKASEVTLVTSKEPEFLTIVREEGEGETAEPVIIEEGSPKDTIRIIADKKGSFTLTCWTDSGEEGRNAYEKIVAGVKKELPEGYALEPAFDEDSGRVTLKITGPSGKTAPKDLIKKLVRTIKEQNS
jgi:beta-lactamase regulating signal transducer with metallopeptidase domain